MDKASIHISTYFATLLVRKESETGIMCIPFNDISVKSDNDSAMGFCIFGLLMRVIGIQHLITMNGFWKTVLIEWSIDMAVLRKSLL